jgi:hypothetical protein
MRGNRGFVGGLALATLVVGCSSDRTLKPVDAAMTADVALTIDGLLILDTKVDIAPDAPVVPPANVTFPEAPEASCGDDAGECPLPPSACADYSCDGGICYGIGWVVYYDNPTCVSGQCVYTKRYFECNLFSECVNGGCRYSGTTAAP